VKRNILLAVGAVVLVLGAYHFGYIRSSMESSMDVMAAQFKYWAQLAELDRAFLTNAVTRPSTLVSGPYVLETHFPGKPPQTTALDLVFTNGRFALPRPEQPGRSGMADTLIQNGSVVSWYHEGSIYEADAECVGLIDGNMMWGRIYGWNPGDESIGIWRIYPKPKD